MRLTLADLVIVNENSTHNICQCPNCESNKSPKLYVDKSTGQYLCFRCGIKGVLSGYELAPLLKEEVVEETKTRKFYNLNGLTKVSSDRSCQQYKYLISRGMNHDDIVKSEIRKFKIYNRPAIIIPNEVINELTNIIQVRFIDNGEFRWLNVSGLEKHIAAKQFLKRSKNLVVTEGFFTAFSVSKCTEYDSIAILGKFLTEIQKRELVELIRNNKYENITIALDEDTFEETLSLYSEVRKLLIPFLNVSVKKLILKGLEGRDFNDMTVEEVSFYLSKAENLSAADYRINKLM